MPPSIRGPIETSPKALSPDVARIKSLVDAVAPITGSTNYDLNALRHDTRVSPAWQQAIAQAQQGELARVVLEMMKTGQNPTTPRADGGYDIDPEKLRAYIDPPTPTGETQNAETRRFVDQSFAEIREAWRSGKSYWQFYQECLPLLKPTSTLNLPLTPENDAAIATQLNKGHNTRTVLDALGQPEATPYVEDGREAFGVKRQQGDERKGSRYRIYCKDGYKLWVVGGNEPEVNNADNMTRLYIALDPRHATDAFTALVKQLDAQGVLDNTQMCLNLEELVQQRRPVPNGIVLYVKNSQGRPDVMERSLQAYRAAKTANPSAFNLEPEDVGGVLAQNLMTYKNIVDENLSFVERTQPESGSWDTVETQRIDQALGIGGMPMDRTHEKYIAALRSGAKNRVYTPQSRQVLDQTLNQMPNVPVGTSTQLDSVRRLNTPGLVQRERVTLTRTQVGLQAV